MRTLQLRVTQELINKTEELVHSGYYSSRSEVMRDALRRLLLKEQIRIHKPEFNIVFAADIHGNTNQYKKLFTHTKKTKPQAIILGGDLLPKDPSRRSIEGQSNYLQKELAPLLIDFKKEQPNCAIYVMLGNDDFRTNNKHLKELEEKQLIKVINNTRTQLYENIDLIGYAYIPLTPFIYKDWEKLDLNQENEETYRKEILLKGKTSKGKNLINKTIPLTPRTNTIEKDLETLFKNTQPNSTLLITHAPPHNTQLDVMKGGEHVGSKAIKKIIEQKQPIISLHGHIHETVEETGNYKELINNTISATPGNNHTTNTINILEINLYEPTTITRTTI